jgi:hypothetical protein
MFRANGPCLIALPGTRPRRTLVGGKVLEIAADKGTLRASFDDPVPLTAGQQVSLFGDLRGRFHRQEATVLTALPSPDGGTACALQPVGEPVEADGRQVFRVAATDLNIEVKIGHYRTCKLVDVGPEGVGVISARPLAYGETVTIRLEYDKIAVEGEFRVHSENELRDGTLRYGLRVMGLRSPARHALQKLAGKLQRLRLAKMRADAA